MDAQALLAEYDRIVMEGLRGPANLSAAQKWLRSLSTKQMDALVEAMNARRVRRLVVEAPDMGKGKDK